MIRKGFIAEGTTCESCEKMIINQAKKIEGVDKVEFDYSKEAGYVTYDKNKTNIDEILYKIGEKGYKCYILKEKNKYKNKISELGFGILGIVIAGYFILDFFDTINLPQISQGMGYGLLFLVGLLTGFHCIAMCGCFVVSYSAKNAIEGKNNNISHLMYVSGKLISYTMIGAIFGLIGSIIAFTPFMRGLTGFLAGIFLILFGLKTLNVFPMLRKIQFKTPKFLSKYVGKETKKHSSPLIVGLLNGLMIACGPLQAIYIMAAGTGSAIEGAKLLFVFGLGTLPVMVCFGYFVSIVSKNLTHKILKASGAIVIALGLVMLNNGLVLTGLGYDFESMVNTVKGNKGMGIQSNFALIKEGYQEIWMDVTSRGWEPNKFVLKKGVPVRWIINGKEINGCNNAIQVPKYGLEFDIKPGKQVIEFTPKEEGIVRWSCWMGMIPGMFIVKNDINLQDNGKIQKELDNVDIQTAETCKVEAGGACGCGGR